MKDRTVKYVQSGGICGRRRMNEDENEGLCLIGLLYINEI
jgi:hypothetical protein